MVYIAETGSVRFTDDSGYYRFHLPEGTYNVTAQQFGYYGDIAIDVVVAQDEFTIRNFDLQLMPTGFIDGTVTDAGTEIPIGGATITVPGTHLSQVTGGDGLYSIEAPIGTYEVMASAVLYVDSVALNVTVPEEGTVTVDFALQPAWVAVLGDYHSQLTDLLIDNGIPTEERGWDIVGDIHHYDAVVVNRPGDPGEETFLEFLQAAGDNEVGVVFTSSWPAGDSYGISLLHLYLGDPAGQSHDYGSGSVYYEVVKPHPIFEDLGDTITIIDSGGKDHAWFWGYSGYTIAGIGSEFAGMQGNAVALNAYGNSLHLLLAGLAPQSFTNVSHWTEDAVTIFLRGVLVAGGRVALDLVVATTGLPAGMVGEEYHAAINAIGGISPYTWDMVGGTLPPGIDFDTDAGVISGTPLEAGSFNFTMQVTDDEGVAATGDLSISVFEWIEFITDPEGDQFEGHGPDIVGLDFYRDEETIFFRVRTAEPVDHYDIINYMFLDLDLDPSTGFVSPRPDMPTNDIGVDAVAAVFPGYYDYGITAEILSLPIRRARDQRRPETQPAQASFPELRGELLLWDPREEDFYYVGEFAVFADTDHFRFAIPLNMLDDDGIMGVVNLIGDYWDWFTDVAPNEGHGLTGQGPDLVISDKWEEWVDEDEGAYTVHYIVRNKGNVAAPAGHETSLTVSGVLLETKAVPIELGPGEEHQDSFDAIMSITPPADVITVCADFYDVVDELSETNNCLTNTVSVESAWIEFITDPEGDQFDGYGPDLVGLDYHRTEDTIYFRVRTAGPIGHYDIINYMFMDLDLDQSTGFVSPDPEMPTNDIGADAAAVVFPAYYYGIMTEEWSLPLLRDSGDEQRITAESTQASSAGLLGVLLLWDPYEEDFHYMAELAVFADTDHFWFTIPLDMLYDDGIMTVVNVIGDYWDWFTDVAPDEGHGVTLSPASPVRTLPGAVLPGDEFEVTVTFTSPADGSNAIGLIDVAPAGWTTSVDTAWTAPVANFAHKPADETAAYIWFGPYDEGVEFTAVYRVQVPPGAAPGMYMFPGGRLEYYILGAGPYVASIVGDFEVEVASVVIKGEIRDVNCDILPNVTVTLYLDDDEIASTVSDDHGHYVLAVPGPGEYTVVAGRDGFRDGEQSIPIDELTAYTVDFVGAHGLVPNAPGMSYVLASINLWQFGEPPCELTMSTVLAVINAWQFPV